MNIQTSDYGRPDLKAYFVARKKADAGWDNRDPEIMVARARYEAGTHTLVQGRYADSIILYAIPFKVRAPQPGYFRPIDAVANRVKPGNM